MKNMIIKLVRGCLKSSMTGCVLLWENLASYRLTPTRRIPLSSMIGLRDEILLEFGICLEFVFRILASLVKYVV